MSITLNFYVGPFLEFPPHTRIEHDSDALSMICPSLGRNLEAVRFIPNVKRPGVYDRWDLDGEEGQYFEWIEPDCINEEIDWFEEEYREEIQTVVDKAGEPGVTRWGILKWCS